MIDVAITAIWFILGMIGVFLGQREDKAAGKSLRPEDVSFVILGPIAFAIVIAHMVFESA